MRLAASIQREASADFQLHSRTEVNATLHNYLAIYLKLGYSIHP